MCRKGEDEIEECCTDQFSQNAEKNLRKPGTHSKLKVNNRGAINLYMKRSTAGLSVGNNANGVNSV